MNNKIEHIVLHHSVSYWGDGETIKHWHCDKKPRGNGWKVPGYHVVICNGFTTYNSWHKKTTVPFSIGRVDRIVPETISTNGVKYGNSNTLHVCIIGNFDEQTLPEKMENKVIDLFTYWCKKYKLDPTKAIRGHGERQIEIGKENYHKTCPGKNIDMRAIRLKVAGRL